jgi:hypothetical protein
MRLHMRELPTRFLLFCAKVLSLRANRGPRTRVVRYFRSPATCAARATLAPRHLLKCGVDCDSVTPKTGPRCLLMAGPFLWALAKVIP